MLKTRVSVDGSSTVDATAMETAFTHAKSAGMFAGKMGVELKDPQPTVLCT